MSEHPAPKTSAISGASSAIGLELAGWTSKMPGRTTSFLSVGQMAQMREYRTQIGTAQTTRRT